MTQARWQKLTEWPLALAAVIFLIAYSYEVIAEPTGRISEIVIAATWVVFLADYAVNLVLAKSRWRWFFTHLLDLAIVVLPMLRPSRLLRPGDLAGDPEPHCGSCVPWPSDHLRGRRLDAPGLRREARWSSTPNGAATAPSRLWVRRSGGPSSTITTVGYGDYFPVTPTGQLVAVGVMVGGIALIGVVTATLASWIVERVGQKEAVTEAITSAHIEALTDEISSLRKLIEDNIAGAGQKRLTST